MKSGLIPGSGINMEYFKPMKTSFCSKAEIRFLLVARLIYDKGILEYARAARVLRSLNPMITCSLLGPHDDQNRTAVPRDEVKRWVKEGIIEYLGTADDVRPYVARSDCVVLPSYREGIPRTLLEAAAMAKPVIATNVPGCREALDDGRTGFLCEQRDPNDLAAKMAAMAEMSPAQRQRMGAAGRAKMKREFDQRIVTSVYVETLSRILQSSGARGEQIWDNVLHI